MRSLPKWGRCLMGTWWYIWYTDILYMIYHHDYRAPQILVILMIFNIANMLLIILCMYIYIYTYVYTHIFHSILRCPFFRQTQLLTHTLFTSNSLNQQKPRVQNGNTLLTAANQHWAIQLVHCSHLFIRRDIHWLRHIGTAARGLAIGSAGS